MFACSFDFEKCYCLQAIKTTNVNCCIMHKLLFPNVEKVQYLLFLINDIIHITIQS